MRIARMILTASIAGMLVAAPVGLAQAVDAHHPQQGAATKKIQPKPKKKVTIKKNQAVKSKQHGQMAMGGMMSNCPMMQRGQGPQSGMMQGGTMQCPMMSAAGASIPFHSLRMQWHHNMMMWHHQMMHGQSSTHRGS